MPKEFIEAERKIARAIRHGKIPKYYTDKKGIRRESNPYALARYATGYYGTTHDMKHHAHKTASLIIRGNDRYVKHMYRHLRKEHPSTRRRMRMF